MAVPAESVVKGLKGQYFMSADALLFQLFHGS